jgi:hypothetical protein
MQHPACNSLLHDSAINSLGCAWDAIIHLRLHTKTARIHVKSWVPELSAMLRTSYPLFPSFSARARLGPSFCTVYKHIKQVISLLAVCVIMLCNYHCARIIVSICLSNCLPPGPTSHTLSSAHPKLGSNWKM